MVADAATLPQLELAGFWRTSATYRVRVALNLKALTASERFIDIDAGQHRDPSFLAINPMGAIPALFVGDAPPLTQSLAILDYLEEVAPAPPLLPAEPLARARVRALALMLAADTHPLIVPRVRAYLMETHGVDMAAWRAWQTHWLTTGLQAVEQRLALDGTAGAFCFGDDVTVADICLASILVVAEIFDISVLNIPTIDRIGQRCFALDAFARAHPLRQQGAPEGG